uniref:Secreted protein n=1 Tax=Oryzias latipes TaxID=8090 RepID=A0A3B3IJ76_ORYLA
MFSVTLAFLLCSLKFTRSFSQAMQHDFEESTLCCFKFSKIPIPFVLVVNVKKTSMGGYQISAHDPSGNESTPRYRIKAPTSEH